MFNDRLDIFLGGGVKCGQITEFSGAPGLGKTQLCFQLAAANVFHGKVNSNGVLYIDSEGAFSALRYCM
jgi:RAD51-like protein 1